MPNLQGFVHSWLHQLCAGNPPQTEASPLSSHLPEKWRSSRKRWKEVLGVPGWVWQPQAEDAPTGMRGSSAQMCCIGDDICAVVALDTGRDHSRTIHSRRTGSSEVSFWMWSFSDYWVNFKWVVDISPKAGWRQCMASLAVTIAGLHSVIWDLYSQ